MLPNDSTMMGGGLRENHSYYFYRQQRIIISAPILTDMETGRIVFFAIVQLSGVICSPGRVRVGEIPFSPSVILKENSKKYQDLILWAWFNSLSLPTGTFLKRHVTAVIFVSGLNNTLKGARETLIRAAILDLITFSRTKSLILTPKMYNG